MKNESLVELEGNAYLKYDRWLIHRSHQYEYEDMCYMRPRETMPLPVMVEKEDGEYKYIIPTEEDWKRCREQWNVWRLHEVGGSYYGAYDSLDEAIQKIEREESIYYECQTTNFTMAIGCSLFCRTHSVFSS